LCDSGESIATSRGGFKRKGENHAAKKGAKPKRLNILAIRELSAVSAILGHSDIYITSKFYSHIKPGLKKKTINLLKI